ncbi:related to isopenicillin N synthase and related dioxygenases [Cephalotrichum gorgonifer]|uniref:Related to isopenicillin N synthase and related dioxygenases n=1 Tax=Cephalotrichum gorgonifer TaxID=2041049 RepID=A0AAE8SY19_9PEZI|nr:related to isopenicillin N synthase and related dioxygenases [Cephalotrichum gorgonifer]
MASSKPELKIPVINISGYLSGDDAAKKSCATELRHAMEDVGFLQVVGHSVSPDLQKRFIEAVAAFFALPMSEKEKIGLDKSPCNRGYERMGVERLEELEDSSKLEQKEGFTVRPERPLGRFMTGPNQWPDPSLPGMSNFRSTYMEYFAAVHQLSTSMFRLISLSLDLDEHYFDAFAADPDGTQLCRSHHYPPTPSGEAVRGRGIGAHTDFGALTLLLQDEIGGLEVLHKPTGTWHHVTPIEGAYVINIGDLMQRWTNDRYLSTMHRVMSPTSSKPRYSVAFFNDGALDVTVEAIPTCVPAGEKPKYPPLKVEDHLLKRYRQSYSLGPAEMKTPMPVVSSTVQSLGIAV